MLTSAPPPRCLRSSSSSCPAPGPSSALVAGAGGGAGTGGRLRYRGLLSSPLDMANNCYTITKKQRLCLSLFYYSHQLPAESTARRLHLSSPPASMVPASARLQVWVSP